MTSSRSLPSHHHVNAISTARPSRCRPAGPHRSGAGRSRATALDRRAAVQRRPGAAEQRRRESPSSPTRRSSAAGSGAASAPPAPTRPCARASTKQQPRALRRLAHVVVQRRARGLPARSPVEALEQPLDLGLDRQREQLLLVAPARVERRLGQRRRRPRRASIGVPCRPSAANARGQRGGVELSARPGHGRES